MAKNKELNRLPAHPGEVVKEELKTRGISQKVFSECIGISPTMLNDILKGKRPVTCDIALIIEAVLGIDPDLLINMQIRYDMAIARLKPSLAKRIEEIKKIAASIVL